MLATLVVFAVVMIAVPTQAQDFENNTGGTYNATCNAVIKMKTNGGVFDGTAPLGVDKANAIDGTVDWASTIDAQAVQPRYYTNLFLSGGTKTLATGIFVVGSGTNTGVGCPTALAGYEDLNGGYPYWIEGTSATYTGTFTFDGAGAQNIFGDNYDVLALTDAGTKTIPTGQTVDVTSISSLATTPLDVIGTLNLGANPSSLAGTVALSAATAVINAGVGTTDFTNTLTITAGTLAAQSGDGAVSTVDINLVGTTSVLDFGDNTNLVISGTLDNDGDGTNLDFTCLSTVTYDGGVDQPVAPTISTNKYGNLTLTGGNKVVGNAGFAGFADDIYACGNFNVNGPNLSMLTAADGTSPESGGILFLTDATKTVTYAANEEVIGSMSRATDRNTPAAYTMNNAETVLTLLVDDDDNPNEIQLYVRPGVSPQGYQASTDVNRQVRFDYLNANTGANNGFDFTAEIGYLYDESPTGGWAGQNTQDRLRLYEADATDLPTQIEKLTGGVAPTPNNATGTGDLGSVTIQNLSNAAAAPTPNGIDLFYTGNDIVLRTGPTTFYSKNDGRWSNPNTWDEGATPTASDDVEIRHVVYAGIDGPFVGTLALNNTSPEDGLYGTADAANNVTIIDADAAAGFANPALVIGNEDNGATYVLSFAGDLINKNNGSTTVFPFNTGADELKGKSDFSVSDFNGLWLINKLLTDGSNTPKLGMQNIINTGTVNNEGIIELGN